MSNSKAFLKLFVFFSGEPGKYAYISTSPILRYATRQEPCTTRTLGHLFLKAGYGIAFARKFRYIEKFNIEILKLREEGFIEELDKKWITGKCPDPKLCKGAFIIYDLGVEELTWMVGQSLQ